MNFYLINLLFVLFSVLFYACFRSGVYTYMRARKYSKTYISKNSKGFINYWFYESINRERPLGFIYYVNKMYLYALPAVSFIVTATGYLEFMQVPIVILTTLLAVIESVSQAFYIVNFNIYEFGSPFVLIGKPKYGRPVTIITDIFGILCPLVFIYLNIREVLL